MATRQLDIQFIGDYEIVRDLGQEMMGRSYLAKHQFLKKWFVLKSLPKELCGNPSFIERFEKEVVLLGAIDHPNIVKIENVFCIDGLYYLVTECHCDSQGKFETLGTYFQKKQKSITESEAFSILHQVALALDYAHELNLYDEPLAHRGLTFNNVILA